MSSSGAAPCAASTRATRRRRGCPRILAPTCASCASTREAARVQSRLRRQFGRAHALADGYPILVIGAASLDDLNARLAAKGSPALPMNRFRPNVVVTGLDPYDEDHLDTLDRRRRDAALVKPCTRCQVTTTDQATARVGFEPLSTLSTYRRNDALAGGGVRDECDRRRRRHAHRRHAGQRRIPVLRLDPLFAGRDIACRHSAPQETSSTRVFRGSRSLRSCALNYRQGCT